MSRARGYVFTLNNYTADELSILTDLIRQHSTRYGIFGKEVGENGTPHLQGYILFHNARSFASVRRELGGRAHVEVSRGTPRQASEYCKKDGDYLEEGVLPLSRGRPDQQELIGRNCRLVDPAVTLSSLVCDGSLSPYQVSQIHRARNILSQEGEALQTESVRGIWLVGAPGTGKSYRIRSAYHSSELYIKAQNKWWDGYSNQDYVLLDDFDCSLLSHYLKIWADRYRCQGEVKGGVVNLKHKIFYITSNYHPSELFADPVMCEAISRRFRIERVMSREQIVVLPE